jgi:hypothetical protein
MAKKKVNPFDENADDTKVQPIESPGDARDRITKNNNRLKEQLNTYDSAEGLGAQVIINTAPGKVDVAAEKANYQKPMVDYFHNSLYPKVMSTGNIRTNVIGKKISESDDQEMIDDYDEVYGNAVIAGKTNGPDVFRPFIERHIAALQALFPELLEEYKKSVPKE